jgi:hypothetical protein
LGEWRPGKFIEELTSGKGVLRRQAVGGVITEYAKMRIEDAKKEAESFFKGPFQYIMDKQILRKAVLLEWLDNVRPVIGTKYEHWVEEIKKR